jgi:hypothetical protein
MLGEGLLSWSLLLGVDLEFCMEDFEFERAVCWTRWFDER